MLNEVQNVKIFMKYRPGLLEAWLVLTSVKYHGNLYNLIPLNQRLALTRLRATGPRMLNHEGQDVKIYMKYRMLNHEVQDVKRSTEC